MLHTSSLPLHLLLAFVSKAFLVNCASDKHIPWLFLADSRKGTGGVTAGESVNERLVTPSELCYLDSGKHHGQEQSVDGP